MDKKERHHEQKGKEREQKKKEEQKYENAGQKKRLPAPAWVMLLGVVLVALALYVMDRDTICAYDREAAAFANDWLAQPAPLDLYALLRQYFVHGPTADIGCGCGRDTAWLTDNGLPAVGLDPSEALLAEARRRFPKVHFQVGRLPELAGIAENSFTNVLCETVIMHLDSASIRSSVRRMLTILKPGGNLYLSWPLSNWWHNGCKVGPAYARPAAPVASEWIDYANPKINGQAQPLTLRSFNPR